MPDDAGVPGANPNLEAFGKIVTGCFKQLFNANRGMTAFKVAIFSAFLTFLAWSFTGKFSGSYAGGSSPSGGGSAEVVMSGPDLVQAAFGFLGLVFVLVGNIYLRHQRQQHERVLIDFATRPGASPDALKIISSLL